MTWTVALAIGAVVAAGVYLVLARDLLRCVIGVSLIAAGAKPVDVRRRPHRHDDAAVGAGRRNRAGRCG
jgi:hypothetical protein